MATRPSFSMSLMQKSVLRDLDKTADTATEPSTQKINKDGNFHAMLRRYVSRNLAKSPTRSVRYVLRPKTEHGKLKAKTSTVYVYPKHRTNEKGYVIELCDIKKPKQLNCCRLQNDLIMSCYELWDHYGKDSISRTNPGQIIFKHFWPNSPSIYIINKQEVIGIIDGTNSIKFYKKLNDKIKVTNPDDFTWYA